MIVSIRYTAGLNKLNECADQYAFVLASEMKHKLYDPRYSHLTRFLTSQDTSINPAFALFHDSRKCFEDQIHLINEHWCRPGKPTATLTEPCAWTSPQQGHQAVLCHAKNVAIAYVLNTENSAKNIASWVRWLRLAGHEDSVSGFYGRMTPSC